MPPKRNRSKIAAKDKAAEPVVEEVAAPEPVVVAEDIVQELNVKDTVIEKAVEALSKWNAQQTEASSKKDMFETDDDDLPLYLQITSKKYFSTSKVIKPRILSLPHSIFDLTDARVCIFVKDGLVDEDALNRIEILKEDKLKNLGQIITVKELKGKYHTFESKRKLLSEYDLFLTDSSIANMIPKLLGKTFFGSSKFPLTITVTDNDKKLSIEKFTKNFNKALSSVGYMLPMGANMSIRLGMLGQDINQLKENVHAVVSFLQKFPIRLIQVKLKNSPSLPIYITEKVYDDADIANSDDETEDKTTADIPLSIYAEGLKELGLDEEEADKIFGSKKKRAAPVEAADEVIEEPKKKKGKKVVKK